MEKSKMLSKIEARNKNIWQEINAADSEIIDSLLVSPIDVQKKLNEIDDEAILNQITKELQESFDLISGQSKTYEAVNYEWRYDSYDLENRAIGNAYEKCTHNFLSNSDTGPDNNWIVLDSDKPLLTGEPLYLKSLSAYLVMKSWYGELLAENQKPEYEADDYDNPYMLMFDELFKLKFFSLLDTAYANVTGVKPGYFCVALFGYWYSGIQEYITQS